MVSKSLINDGSIVDLTGTAENNEFSFRLQLTVVNKTIALNRRINYLSEETKKNL